MHRRLATVALAALAAMPAGSAWMAGPALAAGTKASAKAHTYKGSTANTQWGPLQVIITVKSKKITGVKVVDSTHTARSQVIDNSAIPILKQETLQAQSANINQVSGATTISQAYIQSLQSALQKAHLA